MVTGISQKYHFDDSSIVKIKELLNQPKRICIITHVNPDGDAIGSSLALANLLIKLNHEVTVITPNRMMGFLTWMKGADQVISFNEKSEIAIANIQNADVLFCLDFNNLNRIGDIGDHVVANIEAVKILVDHHLNPQSFCDYVFSFPDACATAEIIYYFIRELGLTYKIDLPISECLYCGVVTDSGNFRFGSVSPELHEITADLLRHGADQNKIYELIYDSNSFDTVRLHGYVLANKMELVGNAIIISLSEEEQRRFNAGKAEIDEIVNFGLKIKDVNLCTFFYENDDMVRVSFRSKGNISVKEIATKYYNGGGHLNAAGGIASKNIDEAVLEFKNLLEKNVIITRS